LRSEDAPLTACPLAVVAVVDGPAALHLAHLLVSWTIRASRRNPKSFDQAARARSKTDLISLQEVAIHMAAPLRSIWKQDRKLNLQLTSCRL